MTKKTGRQVVPVSRLRRAMAGLVIGFTIDAASTIGAIMAILHLPVEWSLASRFFAVLAILVAVLAIYLGVNWLLPILFFSREERALALLADVRRKMGQVAKLKGCKLGEDERRLVFDDE